MPHKALFFIKKTWSDIVAPHRFGTNHIENTSTGYKQNNVPYPLNFTSMGMLEYYKMRTDKNGIVMMPHYLGFENKESHYYSPLKIAHIVLGAFNDFLKTKENHFESLALNHIEYLKASAEFFGDDLQMPVWPTPTGVLRYGVPSPHLSAIVQGLVISALIRGWYLTQKKEYLTLAESAINILQIPVEEGGVMASSKWGKTYEEYPVVPYPHVVNGFIFCLLGLFELWKITDSVAAKNLYISGTETLMKMIPDWILPYWSKYDLYDLTAGKPINLATRHYQYLHIDQLECLYNQTGEQIFLISKHKLEKQLQNPYYNFKIYINKATGLLKMH